MHMGSHRYGEHALDSSVMSKPERSHRWGKSMGAVASLLRTARDRRVDACVLDRAIALLHLVGHMSKW